MSQENVEVVKRIFRAWERGDFSSVDWAAPDIEFVLHSRREGPGDEVLHGAEAMGRAWGEWLSAWDEFRLTAQRFIDLGDEVVVLVEFGGRGKTSGAPIEQLSGGNLFTFRDGKVIRLTTYSDRREALEAAGLRQ
jgi:ketosteroid isomerase-like protein